MQGQRRAAWLAVAVAGLILASCAAGYPHRRLRAEDPATSTDGDPADDQPLYSLVGVSLDSGHNAERDGLDFFCSWCEACGP